MPPQEAENQKLIAHLRRELEAAERRMRSIVNRTADGLLVLDGEGSVLFANTAAEALFGRAEGALVGEAFGYPLVAGESAEIDVPYPAGPPRILEMRTASTEWEGEQATVAALRDVTGRRLAEEALRESERRYRQIFEEAFTANFMSSAKGGLLACNSAFLRIFGFKTEQEAIERDSNAYYAEPAARERFLNLLRERKHVEAYPLELRRGDGSPVFVVENAFGTFDENGELTAVTGFLLDLTEQRNLEQQLRQAQKMEAVGRLAGGVAHDFNNLLTIIDGYVTMTLDRLGPDDPSRPNLLEVLRASERASSLTKRLLAFSRRQMIQPRNIDLNTLLRDMEPSIRDAAGPEIRLSILPGEGLGVISADASQLEQAVMNLVVNARDAMPGGGDLRIESYNTQLDASRAAQLGLASGSYVALSVRDSGLGMDADIQAHLFEPFFTTKVPGRGTGLGLSIVYGVVRQSGGAIAVRSERGKGTTFDIYLPRTGGSMQASRARAVVETARPGTETVLLVEDEEGVRKLVRMVLEQHGYRVIEAALPDEALRLSREHRFELLLTDMMMPQMNGRELAEAVGALHPSARVLFMSGYTEDAIVRLGMLRPGSRLLQKPFSPEALTRAVREVLDSAAPQDARA